MGKSDEHGLQVIGKRCMATLMAGSAVLFGPSCLAQDRPAPADEASRSTVSPNNAPDNPNVIVVTATKREQTLQDVPVAVSVVSEATIENAQIIDIFDIQSVVPSLQVSQRSAAGGNSFTIRGFGNGQSNPGVEPSVGVFVDGVYRSRSFGAISDLAEIQRIEVLRGPQSTLFGRNSSAGVVSIATKKPEFALAGKVEATYGNYDQQILRGYITGPIADNLAVSLEGGLNKRDGFATNVITGGDLNERDRWNIRGQIYFEPSDRLSVRVIGDYDRFDENCCYAGIVQSGPVTPLIRALGGTIITDYLFRYEAAFTRDPRTKLANGGVSAQIDADLGWGSITSITAYRELDLLDSTDSDFTSLDTIDLTSNDVEIGTFTQEIRLSSETDRFDWLVGGFYTNETADVGATISYGPDQRAFANALSGGGLLAAEQALLAAGVLPPGTRLQSADDFSRQQFRQRQESFSLFGQLDVPVTDRLTLTAGLNYSIDRKKVSFQDDNRFTFSNLNLVSIGGGFLTQQAIAQGFVAATGGTLPPTAQNIGAFAAANPVAFAQIRAGAQAFANANATNPAVNPLLPLAALQFLPPSVEFPNSVEDGRSRADDVSYTLRAAYELTDNLNAYISYATGFKPTSWNLSRDSRPAPDDISALAAAGLLPDITRVALGTYAGSRKAAPEQSRVFELGLKSQFNWGSVYLTLFDQKIDNFQTNAFQGTGFVFLNAGQQSSRGAELEIFASPAPWIDLNVGATYIDAVFDDYVGAPGLGGVPVDLSGTRVPQIPEFASSTAVTLKQDFGWANAFARMDWQYETSAQLETNLPEALKRQVSTFNASLGLNLTSGLEFLIYGRNIFQDKYYTGGFPAVGQQGSYLAYPNAPRTYGITVRQKF